MTTTATTDIEITVAQQDAASRTLHVTVPASRVQAEEQQVVRTYGRQARVPGFRKGNVPPAVVRRRFAEAIRQSVLEALVREAWDRAREAHRLRPIGDPRITNLTWEAGTPLVFDVIVDVKPELALERVGGFRLTRHVTPVTEEMVDAQLLALREQRAPWVPVEGRPKPGDMVEAAITNLDEGEGAAAEPVRFVLGQGRALPDLEAHAMELEPGGTWEGSVRFPEDHPEPAKRGQVRHLRLHLTEVKRRQLPDVSDAFAAEVGPFASVAELLSAVRADLEADARREADARLRGELVDQIAAANNVAVPASLLDRALHAYAHAYGVAEDQHDRFAGEFRPVAEAQVRRDLILESVAERQQLHATAEEVAARVAEIAARRGESPAAVRAALEKAGRLRELERSITDDKVFAYLLGQSAVEDAPAAR